MDEIICMDLQSLQNICSQAYNNIYYTVIYVINEMYNMDNSIELIYKKEDIDEEMNREEEWELMKNIA
tara:strand:+ start:542 stop:745 length:204 start_codon:yes stop_codon:yes gene_type:complete